MTDGRERQSWNGSFYDVWWSNCSLGMEYKAPLRSQRELMNKTVVRKWRDCSLDLVLVIVSRIIHLIYLWHLLWADHRHHCNSIEYKALLAYTFSSFQTIKSHMSLSVLLLLSWLPQENVRIPPQLHRMVNCSPWLVVLLHSRLAAALYVSWLYIYSVTGVAREQE